MDLCRVFWLFVGLFTFSQGLSFDVTQEASYLAAFSSIVAQSYSEPRPTGLTSACAQQGNTAALNTKVLTGTVFTASQLQSQCSTGDICDLPAGSTLTMDANLNVGALIIRGSLVWTDATQPAAIQWLCAGYVVMNGGIFTLKVINKQAIIYIKDNGAFDPLFTKRGFGGFNGALIDIQGKPLMRTWSLLAVPGKPQESQITLMHNVADMGWAVGNRIVIAPTTELSSGTAESYFISSISGPNITLGDLKGGAGALSQSFQAQADWIDPAWTALRQAEVIMMTRNVIITGDDFVQENCQAGAPLSETNVTCTCDPSVPRSVCTRGLHTGVVGNGTYRLQYTRLEKCGQRGILGKYCVHMHMLKQCPNCLIQGNSVEFSHQRGIVTHDTSLATIEANVLNDVRGANIYVEDGDEMYNRIRFNVVICPWAQNTQPGQPERYACTVPGTDNNQADTSVNHAAFWALSFSNYVIGNRAANTFNGMLYQAQGFENGRQTSQGRICPNNQMVGRLEGNTFHGHGRFGTYLLVSIYPKRLDRSLATGGLVDDLNTCAAFDANGEDRGLPQVLTYNVDYDNVFVGQYFLGDIQYRHHASIFNHDIIYWKETKNFADGCSSHVLNSWWQGKAGQGISLPGGHGTMIMENVTYTGEINFECSHHCNIGTTGVLCMPTYVFVNPTWKAITSTIYVRWGPNNGAMFTLGPKDCANPRGVIFPAGYCSLANPFWTYLQALDSGKTCQNVSTVASLTNQSAGFVTAWAGGIMCKAPLRRLEIFTQGQSYATAPNLMLQLWQNNKMISSVTVPYFQIGDDGLNSGKQGYSMTVIPGVDKIYKLSLVGGGPIPADWAIEFSDVVFGNRWTRDQIILQVAGRTCPPIVHSHHDRRFIWGDSNDFNNTHNWMRRTGRGACTVFPDMPQMSCTNGIPVAEPCPGRCPPCGPNSFCDCGRGVCMCEAGYSGPSCAISPCTEADCDSNNGRCAARYLGGTLKVVVGQCVCKPGFFGPKCRSDPCSCTSCGSHGQCIKTGAITYYCQCDPGWQGLTCNVSCSGTNCTPPCIDGCQYFNDSGFNGPDISNFPLGYGYQSAVSCCQACQADPGCGGFNSPDWCYLKNTSQGSLFSRPGCISGIRCQTLSPVHCPDAITASAAFSFIPSFYFWLGLSLRISILRC